MSKIMKWCPKNYPNKNNFVAIEQNVQAGEALSLDWWWHAGEECVANYKGNASKYADAATSLGAKRNTEGTIRTTVGVVVRAIKAGYVREDFGTDMGIDHVRQTMKGSGQRAVTTKKATPKAEAEKVLAKMDKRQRRALFLALQEEFA